MSVPVARVSVHHYANSAGNDLFFGSIGNTLRTLVAQALNLSVSDQIISTDQISLDLHHVGGCEAQPAFVILEVVLFEDVEADSVYDFLNLHLQEQQNFIELHAYARSYSQEAPNREIVLQVSHRRVHQGIIFRNQPQKPT